MTTSLGPSLLTATALFIGATDRLFARAGSSLRRDPSAASLVVRPLSEGDELVLSDPPVTAAADLRGNRALPAGWVFVQTVDAPSGRAFSGFLAVSATLPDPPTPVRRAAVLRRAVESALDSLESRRAPFQALHGEILAWQAKAKGDADARAEAERLETRLAAYMEAEVTPLALDIEDGLAELRDLGDSKAAPLARRFEQAARAFRP